MLSVFRSEQNVVLWRYKVAVLANGSFNLHHFAKFNFESFSLRPRYARFLGNERCYIEFEDPRLRIYNLGEVNLYLTRADEQAKNYEYEIFFTDSKLTIRSPYFDGKTEDRELRFNFDYPSKAPPAE